MHFFLAGMMLCLFSFILSASSTPVSEMREFVAITNSMAELGVRMGISLSSKKSKNKLGLLLGINPSTLTLVPDDFEFRKEKSRPSPDLDRIVSIADKLQDIKLICPNEKVRQKFPEWSLMEPCEGDSAKVFGEYMSTVFDNRSRIAATMHDLIDAPIMELGVLMCQKVDGPCLTPRPSEIELNSFLSAPIQESTILHEPTAAELTTVLEPALLTEPRDDIVSISVSTISSEVTETPKPALNTLDSPPLYNDDITGYESYLSNLKEITSTGTSKSTATLMWVKPLATRPQGEHKTSPAPAMTATDTVTGAEEIPTGE